MRRAVPHVTVAVAAALGLDQSRQRVCGQHPAPPGVVVRGRAGKRTGVDPSRSCMGFQDRNRGTPRSPSATVNLAPTQTFVRIASVVEPACRIMTQALLSTFSARSARQTSRRGTRLDSTINRPFTVALKQPSIPFGET